MKGKKIAILMAVIALVSFGYKFTIAILAASLVLIIAAIPTFLVFICKALYARHMDQTKAQKKSAYFKMTIATTCVVAIFVLFSILKVGNIDITPTNTFDGWISYVFIAFIILMFCLSIINLKGALNKDDLVIIGIKEITFVSALADAVMIYEFLYRALFKHLNLPFFNMVSNYFPLAIGVLMVLVPINMFKRYFSYEA